MAASNESRGSEKQLSPDDMRLWLRDEIRRVMKAAELQIKDATDFVTKYSAAEIDASQANARMMTYDKRWGTSELVLAMPSQTMTDDEILRKIDARIAEQSRDSHRRWIEEIRSKPSERTPP
jgi:hypothetical protein